MVPVEQWLRRVHRASVRYQQGELAQAAAILAPIRHEISKDANALHLCALVERGLGRLQNAIFSMQTAIVLAPRRPELHCTLGNLLHEGGEPEQAAVCFQQALLLDPQHKPALQNLATLLMASERSEQAVTCLRQLCVLEPTAAHPWSLLGIALSNCGAGEQAIEALEKAVELGPQYADAFLNLGVAYGYAGRRDESQAAFRKAIEIDPRCARAWEGLVRSLRLSAADRPLLRRLQSLRGELDGDTDAAVTFDFALGKSFDDLQDFDTAFAYYRRGNDAMKLRLPGYSANAEESFLAIAMQHDEPFITRSAHAGSEDRTPVFVVGMPRSGTTVVEQMLGTHPLVYCAGELNLIPQVAARLCNAAEPYPHGFRSVSAAAIREQANSVLFRLKAMAPGARHVVDKLPGNYMYLGLIHILFPNASIIHCRRGPIDTALSLYFQRFQNGHDYSYDQEWLVRQYRAYARLMAHWRTVMGNRFLDIDYETLVSDPQGGAKRLFSHLGLDIEDRSPGTLSQRAVVTTASSWQVREPIYMRSVKRWTNYQHNIATLIDGLHELDTLNSSSLE